MIFTAKVTFDYIPDPWRLRAYNLWEISGHVRTHHSPKKVTSTRRAPTSYKYGYNLSYPFLRPVIGVITPFTTSRGPPCRMARWFIFMVHVESNMPVPWMLWDWFTNRWTESHGFLGRWKKGAYKHASVGFAFATWTFDFRKEPFKLLGCLNNSPNLVICFFPGKDWRLPFHFQLFLPGTKR